MSTNNNISNLDFSSLSSGAPMMSLTSSGFMDPNSISMTPKQLMPNSSGTPFQLNTAFGADGNIGIAPKGESLLSSESIGMPSMDYSTNDRVGMDMSQSIALGAKAVGEAITGTVQLVNAKKSREQAESMSMKEIDRAQKESRKDFSLKLQQLSEDQAGIRQAILDDNRAFDLELQIKQMADLMSQKDNLTRTAGRVLKSMTGRQNVRDMLLNFGLDREKVIENNDPLAGNGGLV